MWPLFWIMLICNGYFFSKKPSQSKLAAFTAPESVAISYRLEHGIQLMPPLTETESNR